MTVQFTDAYPLVPTNFCMSNIFRTHLQYNSVTLSEYKTLFKGHLKSILSMSFFAIVLRIIISRIIPSYPLVIPIGKIHLKIFFSSAFSLRGISHNTMNEWMNEWHPEQALNNGIDFLFFFVLYHFTFSIHIGVVPLPTCWKSNVYSMSFQVILSL